MHYNKTNKYLKQVFFKIDAGANKAYFIGFDCVLLPFRATSFGQKLTSQT